MCHQFFILWNSGRCCILLSQVSISSSFTYGYTLPIVWSILRLMIIVVFVKQASFLVGYPYKTDQLNLFTEHVKRKGPVVFYRFATQVTSIEPAWQECLHPWSFAQSKSTRSEICLNGVSVQAHPVIANLFRKCLFFIFVIFLNICGTFCPIWHIF